MPAEIAGRAALTVVSSPSASVRIAAAEDFLSSHHSSVERLLVSETREAADELARVLVQRAKTVFGLHRFSFYQLAAQLASPDLADQGFAVASMLGAEAVAARSAFDAVADDSLGYFGRVARLRSFGRTLAGTLAELRGSGVDLSKLAQYGAQGQDLRVLAERYDHELVRAGLVDRPALFRIAAAALEREDVRVPIPTAGPLVLLDVAVGDEATHGLVRALCGVASEVLATVPDGDERTLDALSRLSGGIVERPAERSPSPVESNAPTSGDDRYGVGALERVRTYLFAPDVPVLVDETEPDTPAVYLFSAPGEDRECVEIARKALREAERGIPLDRMAILVRSPELYAGLLETALARAGLEGWFVDGTRAPDPAGRAFLAILACAAEQLSARRFSEYLSLAQVPPLTERGTPPTEPAAWVTPDGAESVLPSPAVPVQLSLFDTPPAEVAAAPAEDAGEKVPVLGGSLRTPLYWDRLLVESAVIGGHDRWMRRLDGLARELQLRREEEASEEPDSPRVHAIDRDLRNLRHLSQFALPVIERLAAFPERARWGEWLDRLERLAPMVLRRPERVLAVLGELRPMEQVGPVPLAEVRQVLSERLTGLQRVPPPRRYGRVFVGRPEQARGRRFDVVFVPGLAERLFPQKQRQDPLLLDDLREHLNDLSDSERPIGGHAARRLGLPTRDDRASAERLLLRLAVGAAGARLYLSYPRLQLSEARARVPSFYALDVERARYGRVPDFQSLQRSADQEARARLAWPAPDDADLAIDDTEHDLAVLGPLLRQDVTPAIEGRARYLLTLNPGLRRSLLTRWARWRAAWSGYDGLCRVEGASRVALDAHRLGARPYSVSALQRFARCPYQFLLSAIYRLEPREEIQPLERMDPLTRGRLFHEVQAEFVRAMKAREAVPITTAGLPEAEKALDETLNRVAARYHEDLAPAIERVWADEVESMRADLKGWLQRVAEEEGEWIPIHAEFGFGFGRGGGRDPDSVPTAVCLDGRWQLHGVVDLIEAKAGPTPEGELRVTDHKTGRDRTRDRLVVGHGEVLQPVLYGLAVERALNRRVESSRLFFSTVAGAFGIRSVTLADRERRHGIEVLEIVDRALEKGELLPAPRDGACRWCDFQDVCGPWEEARVRRKDQSRLADLEALRRLP